MDVFQQPANVRWEYDVVAEEPRRSAIPSLNVVMLGSMIGSGMVPATEEVMRKAISSSSKKAFLESNLTAFSLCMGAAKKLK